MKIEITEAAVQWFKSEYDIDGDTSLRLFVRYGGFGGNIPAFSLGVNIEEPNSIHTQKKVDNLTFFVEESDAWYFEEKDLSITINENLHEPQFNYFA